MMTMDRNLMDWSDTIESDGQDFVVLPEGDYAFTVTRVERGRFPGSSKIPPCNKATVSVRIDNDLGPATARFDLILYRTLEWKIAAFFRSIGQKKHGEKLVMDWRNVVGARGRAHFRPRAYLKDGEERQVNDVCRFLDAGPDGAWVEVLGEELPWTCKEGA